jgi:hypothetical protein
MCFDLGLIVFNSGFEFEVGGQGFGRRGLECAV